MSHSSYRSICLGCVSGIAAVFAYGVTYGLNGEYWFLQALGVFGSVLFVFGSSVAGWAVCYNQAKDGPISRLDKTGLVINIAAACSIILLLILQR